MHATALELLVAVGRGEERSFELARTLARGILDDAVVKRAMVLEALLREGSAFALVRPVELAELVAAGVAVVGEKDGTG